MLRYLAVKTVFPREFVEAVNGSIIVLPVFVSPFVNAAIVAFTPSALVGPGVDVAVAAGARAFEFERDGGVSEV